RRLLPPPCPPRFLTHPTPPATYPLSLHDALPIFQHRHEAARRRIETAVGHEHYMVAGSHGFAQARQQRVGVRHRLRLAAHRGDQDRKSTRLNSSHVKISYAVFCLKKKKKKAHSPI